MALEGFDFVMSRGTLPLYSSGMESGNRASAPIFSATLTPHRSLGRQGLRLLLAVLGSAWLAIAFMFWRLGAWPVAGFVGIEFLAIGFAFRLNARAARAYEAIEVTQAALAIRKVSPAGRVREFLCNPRWARLEVEHAEEEGVTRIAIRTREARVPLGAFLNPDDRTSFARALAVALATARR